MIAIVKPVGNYCNLRCEYCFYNRQDQGEMQLISDDLLLKFLSELRGVAPRAVIIWHGGEPLTAGRAFYRKAFDLEAKLWETGQVTNLVQTNGTLITPEWAKFFKANDFRVGVSLDGCPNQHDQHRKTVNGKSSHRAALRGIRILQEFGVDFGVIETVTRDSLAFGAESFDYLHRVVGTHSFSLNVFQALESDDDWVKGQNVSDEEWGDYLETIFNKWLEANDPKLIVREIETAIQGACGHLTRACRFNGSCGHYFCLEPDGRVFPCDRLMQESDLWGNLTENSLADIIAGERRQKFLEEIESSYVNCAGCDWFNSCHNGCGSHRVGGVSGKFFYCESMKRTFELAHRALREIQTTGGV